MCRRRAARGGEGQSRQSRLPDVVRPRSAKQLDRLRKGRGLLGTRCKNVGAATAPRTRTKAARARGSCGASLTGGGGGTHAYAISRSRRTGDEGEVASSLANADLTLERLRPALRRPY